MLKYLLMGIALISLAGCSEGTAAPVQNTSVRLAKKTESLAPGSSANTTPIKIPEIKRLNVGTFKSPAPEPKLQSSSTESERVSMAVSAEQDKRNNRRNGKTELRQRSDRDSESKSSDTAEKTASKISAEKTFVAVNQENGSIVQDAPIPASTSSSTTATSGTSANMVTFGSASSGSTRNFKKPPMPGNVPSWYTDNDKDGDGQVLMHEWPQDRFAEFTKYDRNGDGIITLDEAMRTVPKAAPAVASTTPAPATTTSTPTTTATPSTTTTTAAAGNVTAAPAAAVPGMRTSISFNGSGGAPGTPLSEEDAKRRVDMVYMFADSNKDNILDTGEIENARSIRNVDWKKYDANHDGKLDKTEAIALYKAEGNNMRGGGGMGGGPGGGGPGGGPWSGNQDERIKAMFDRMDRDKTGKLNKEQFPGFWRDRFDEFDTNKDGFVNLDEYKAGYTKIISSMGGGMRGGPGGPGRGGMGGDNGGRGGRGGEGGGRGGFDGGGRGRGGFDR